MNRLIKILSGVVLTLMSAQHSSVAQSEPFPRHTDGRYYIEFHGLKTVLIEADPALPNNSPRENMAITLIFQKGSSANSERYSYWPVSRVLKEADRFKQLLADSQCISIINSNHVVSEIDITWQPLSYIPRRPVEPDFRHRLPFRLSLRNIAA
jgi:hypothetical protein